MYKFLSTYAKLVITAFVIFVLFTPTSVFADTTATLLPVRDGNYLQWTPSTGTSHFALVNEASCNGVTNYNSETTVGQRDSYGVDISSIPNAATITQIVLTPCASRNSSGGTNPVMNLFYRFSSVDSADAGAYTLSGTTTPTVLGTTTFSGLAKVKGSTSTLEFGAVLTSGTKGARLSQLSGVVTYTPLATPSGLTAVALSTESAKLTWSDNATTETGYKVERGTDGVNFTQIASTSANSTSYIDKNVIGTFYYRVRATNSGGDSGYSNTASTTVTLNAPSSLNALGLSSESARLTWADNSSNETSYKIERGTDGVNFTQIATKSANTTTYLDQGIVGTYYYRVRAANATSDSAYSNVASATAVLIAPTNLSVVNSSGSGLLTWNATSSAGTGFQIESSTDNVNFSLLNTVALNVHTYTDPTPPSGTYYYRVRTYAGVITSTYSNTVSITFP